MKRAKKKKKPKIKANIFPYFDPNKAYVMTGQQLNELRDEMAEEATRKATMLNIGGLATKLGWSEDEIVEFYSDIDKWIGFANDGVLPCKDVQAIIEKHNGMKFKEKWYK